MAVASFWRRLFLLDGHIPVFPLTLIFSRRNFSNEAMSIILSLTGFVQSITNDSAFFLPLGATGRAPLAFPFADISVTATGQQKARKQVSRLQLSDNASKSRDAASERKPSERNEDSATVAAGTARWHTPNCKETAKPQAVKAWYTNPITKTESFLTISPSLGCSERAFGGKHRRLSQCSPCSPACRFASFLTRVPNRAWEQPNPSKIDVNSKCFC